MICICPISRTLYMNMSRGERENKTLIDGPLLVRVVPGSLFTPPIIITRLAYNADKVPAA